MKYRKHTQPYKAKHIALLPVVADTVGHLHADAVRLLYHAATVKASAPPRGGFYSRDRGARSPKR